MTKIYLDMDGVLFDFDREISRRGLVRDPDSRLTKQNVHKSQWTEDEKEFDLQLQIMMSEPGFFRNLPLIDGADKLWTVVPKPYVLTARPKNPESAHRVRQEKRDSLEEHFGQVSDDRFICCLRSEKKKYATSRATDSYFKIEPEIINGISWGPNLVVRTLEKSNILVDDLEWNCSEWEKAGGIAIHFQSTEQAIEDLKKVVNATN